MDKKHFTHPIIDWLLHLWDSIVDWFGGNIYQKCIIFCNKYNVDAFCKGVNLGEFSKDYRWLVNNIMLFEFGFPAHVRSKFINNQYTRWDHFVPTAEEDRKDIVDWAMDIVGEIFYCSDRWSLDKLIKISWMYSVMRSAALPFSGMSLSDNGNDEDLCFFEAKKEGSTAIDNIDNTLPLWD